MDASNSSDDDKRARLGGYQLFTDKARRVVQLAKREAVRFNHEQIDPEHLLLGIIGEGSGVAAAAMQGLGIDFDQLRGAVEAQMVANAAPVPGKLPQSARMKQALAQARDAAVSLAHDWVGTEHLLLGLLADPQVAGQTLRSAGLDAERVRESIVQLLGSGLEVDPPAGHGPGVSSAAADSDQERHATHGIEPSATAPIYAELPGRLAPRGLTVAAWLPKPVLRRLQARRETLGRKRLAAVMPRLLACPDRPSLEALIGPPQYAVVRDCGFRGVDFQGRRLSPTRVEVYERAGCIFQVWFYGAHVAQITGGVAPSTWDLVLALRAQANKPCPHPKSVPCR
ncbi:MAG: Clp protease N-terminal domain-containing protein [Pirellulales bacterium]